MSTLTATYNFRMSKPGTTSQLLAMLRRKIRQLDGFLASVILKLGSLTVQEPVQSQMPLERFAYFLASCETQTVVSVESFLACWAQEEAWSKGFYSSAHVVAELVLPVQEPGELFCTALCDGDVSQLSVLSCGLLVRRTCTCGPSNRLIRRPFYFCLLLIHCRKSC